ncbi:DUF4328 domain-containing protein [Streptomyces sp. SS1-1]|uniref:DUF4328 domain-containing protein n=1 Tax=Streptomyces sp. SS1-1 TaxID=2651869 RepID=UPI00124FA7D9|nr:DUF4328 domain-containing protein [Streptomyces sp. SS1-1]KAB2976544.1 DUF4328 domain-containing protein [Streptomyces sp. SS1-1]
MSVSSDPLPPPHTRLPGGVRPASQVLLVVVCVLLAGMALTDLFAVFAGLRIRTLTGADPARALDGAYTLYERAGDLQGMVTLPGMVVFVVWFYLMRRDLGVLAPDAFRNGRGWAVGGWLIPFVNLWMPYRVAVDMWGAAAPLPRRASLWPVNLWWGLFVGGTLLGRYASSGYADSDGLTEVREAVAQYVAADLLNAGAAVAAGYVAVRLTAMQRFKAARGPFAG